MEMKDSEASTSTPKRKEPSSEKLPNFSRVVPAQVPYISFPADGRYQPVRVLSTKSAPLIKGKAAAPKSSLVPGLTSERYTGGGGILILADQRPDEEPDYIEFETQTIVAANQAVPATDAHATHVPEGRHIALDENAPEVTNPPESFEVRQRLFWCSSLLTTGCSTLLIKTHEHCCCRIGYTFSRRNRISLSSLALSRLSLYEVGPVKLTCFHLGMTLSAFIPID